MAAHSSKENLKVGQGHLEHVVTYRYIFVQFFSVSTQIKNKLIFTDFDSPCNVTTLYVQQSMPRILRYFKNQHLEKHWHMK